MNQNFSDTGNDTLSFWEGSPVASVVKVLNFKKNEFVFTSPFKMLKLKKRNRYTIYRQINLTIMGDATTKHYINLQNQFHLTNLNKMITCTNIIIQ